MRSLSRGVSEPEPQGPQDPLVERARAAAEKRRKARPVSIEAKASEVDPDDTTYAGRFATTLLSAAQAIPGMEALQAGAGALGSQFTDNPMDYRESLETLRGATGKMGTGRRIAAQVVGAAPLLPFLPANPTAAGAILGGAGQAFEADPNVGMGERALRTAAGSVLGAASGFLANQLMGGIQNLASRATGSSAKIMQGAKAARDEAAGPLYAAAEREMGAGGAPTADVQAFLSRPDVAQIVQGLQAYDEFKGVAPDSYQMLDAVRKVLSDRSGKAARQAAMANPTNPNLGRFERRQLGASKDAFRAATDVLMPSYQKGMDVFAAGSKNVEAIRRAQDAFKSAMQKAPPTGRNIDRTTPEAFEEFMQAATPEARALANKTLFAASRGQGVGGREAARMLSSKTGAPAARAMDVLLKLGLVGTESALAP